MIFIVYLLVSSFFCVCQNVKESAPEIKILEGDSITKNEGESLILTCEATGNPQPTLKWIKFNSDVNLSSKHIINDSILMYNNKLIYLHSIKSLDCD